MMKPLALNPPESDNTFTNTQSKTICLAPRCPVLPVDRNSAHGLSGITIVGLVRVSVANSIRHLSNR